MSQNNIDYIFRLYFAQLAKIAHFFSGENGFKFFNPWKKSERTLSRYEHAKSCPTWDKGMQFLVENHISIENLMRMFRGEYPTLEEIKQRINPQGKTTDNPVILITPIDTEHKRRWILNNNRVLINYIAGMSENKLKLWRMAEYVLLYDIANPEIARLFRLDPNNLPIETDANNLKTETDPYPGIYHEKYMEFHMLPNVWYDIWDIDWFPIYNTKKVTPPLTMAAFLSEFFQSGQMKSTTPLSSPLSSPQIPDEPQHMQTAADDGDGLPTE